MDAIDFLSQNALKTEQALGAYIAGWTDAPPILTEAIRHSLFAGGKRLRPALALGACAIVGGSDAPALPVACALEMIHTYSLIHDDLPCMDDDDLRRGRPACHKVYGEAMAVLAGDALLTMAFDVAAQTGNIEVIMELARGAGAAGMVGGQVIDMEPGARSLDLSGLRAMHAAKTGALIRASVRCGAILGGATRKQLDALTSFAEHIGLAFQIADDVLDVTGDSQSMGKTAGADAARDKSTYPALLGLDESRRLAREAGSLAIDALTVFGAAADSFRAVAIYIVDRDR